MSCIVVWVHHGLGDVIMALPSLVELDKNNTSGNCISLIVKSGVEKQLLELVDWKEIPNIYVMEYDGSWPLLKVYKLALFLRGLKPKYFIAPHAADSFMANLFALMIGADSSVGPASDQRRFGFSDSVGNTIGKEHKVIYYSRYFVSVGVSSVSKLNIKMNLQGPLSLGADRSSALAQDCNLITIAPGSSTVESHKRWSPEKYVDLVNRLLDSGDDFTILLLGSPSERPLLEGIQSSLTSSSSDKCFIASQPKISTALKLLERSVCVVDGCTGTLHMAALVDAPIVGLYGPTNHSITGPYTTRMRIVRMNYECSPCYRPGFEMGCNDPVCMSDLSVEMVLKAVMKTVSGSSCPRIPRLVTTNANKSNREISDV